MAFAVPCLQNYHCQDWPAASLLEFYAKECASISVDDFKAIAIDTGLNLCDLLRKQAVHLVKGGSISIPDSLYQLP